MKSSEFIAWCDKITVFSFYALIYFVPISTALVEILSGFIITAFFFKRGAFFYIKSRKIGKGHKENSVFGRIRDSFKPVPTYLNKFIGFFMLVNFLSVVFSHYPGLSIKGFVCRLFQGVVLFSTFVECMATKKQIKTFVNVYLISATLVVSNGLAQYFQGRGFVHGHLLSNGRVLSSLNHANDLGAYLIVVIMLIISFVVAWLFDKNRKSFCTLTFKVVLSCLLLATLGCLGLTFSRGAWVGFFSALIFLGIQRRNVIYIPVLIAVLFSIAFLPRLSLMRNVSFFSDNVAREQRQEKDEVKIEEEKKIFEDKNLVDENLVAPGPRVRRVVPLKNVVEIELGDQKVFLKSRGFTGRSRTIWWKEALSIIREFPALGTGLNTYSRVAPKYKLQREGGVYPHNCYLQMTAETGLLGLASFLGILFFLFKHSLENLRIMKDPYLSAVLLGGLSGLAGFLVHSFFDTNFYSVQLGNLMWLVMGLIVAAQMCPKEQSS